MMPALTRADFLLWADSKAKEGAIRDAMFHYGCGVEDLRLEIFVDGGWRIVHISQEERWLDWHSNNHGWERWG